MINENKSSFFMYEKESTTWMNKVKSIAGFVQGQFPFMYLGCPITHTRKRKAYYNDLMKKVRPRLQNCKGKLLCFGRKVVLINSVLQSIPLYLLSTMAPPKFILYELHKTFNRFLWVRSKHWVSWEKMCFPKEEGGVGFRDLFDISKAIFAKLWWIFMTTRSLWTDSMRNKYCKKPIPTEVQWNNGFQVWKKMLEARDDIEK